MSLAILCSLLSLRAPIQVQGSSPTHGYCSFPGTLCLPRPPRIAFWDPAASQITGLCKGCLSLGTNMISSLFQSLLLYLLCWWMVPLFTHFRKEEPRRHPKWIPVFTLHHIVSETSPSPLCFHCFNLDLLISAVDNVPHESSKSALVHRTFITDGNFYMCTIQYDSQQPCVGLENFKCG